MNLNLIGYSIYLSITIFIIIVVGKICYRNGNVFVSALIPRHEDLCHTVNRILLIGYYLMNIGYCAMTIIGWNKIETPVELVETIAIKSAIIVCIIAIMHYANIFLLTNYIQKLIK